MVDWAQTNLDILDTEFLRDFENLVAEQGIKIEDNVLPKECTNNATEKAFMHSSFSCELPDSEIKRGDCNSTNVLHMDVHVLTKEKYVPDALNTSPPQLLKAETNCQVSRIPLGTLNATKVQILESHPQLKQTHPKETKSEPLSTMTQSVNSSSQSFFKIKTMSDAAQIPILQPPPQMKLSLLRDKKSESLSSMTQSVNTKSQLSTLLPQMQLPLLSKSELKSSPHSMASIFKYKLPVPRVTKLETHSNGTSVLQPEKTTSLTNSTTSQYLFTSSKKRATMKRHQNSSQLQGNTKKPYLINTTRTQVVNATQTGKKTELAYKKSNKISQAASLKGIKSTKKLGKNSSRTICTSQISNRPIFAKPQPISSSTTFQVSPQTICTNLNTGQSFVTVIKNIFHAQTQGQCHEKVENHEASNIRNIQNKNVTIIKPRKCFTVATLIKDLLTPTLHVNRPHVGNNPCENTIKHVQNVSCNTKVQNTNLYTISNPQDRIKKVTILQANNDIGLLGKETQNVSTSNSKLQVNIVKNQMIKSNCSVVKSLCLFEDRSGSQPAIIFHQPNYSCKICDTYFITENDLNEHNVCIHGLKNPVNYVSVNNNVSDSSVQVCNNNSSRQINILRKPKYVNANDNAYYIKQSVKDAATDNVQSNNIITIDNNITQNNTDNLLVVNTAVTNSDNVSNSLKLYSNNKNSPSLPLLKNVKAEVSCIQNVPLTNNLFSINRLTPVQNMSHESVGHIHTSETILAVEDIKTTPISHPNINLNVNNSLTVTQNNSLVDNKIEDEIKTEKYKIIKREFTMTENKAIKNEGTTENKIIKNEPMGESDKNIDLKDISSTEIKLELENPCPFSTEHSVLQFTQGKKRYKCKYCENKYLDIFILNRHLSAVHKIHEDQVYINFNLGI